MSSIPLSLSTKKKKKKVIYRLYTLLFVIFFLNLKNRNSLPNNYFLFLVFWKLFLKVGVKRVKYKNYYLKTSFKFNFLKIVFILFWKKKKKITLPIRPIYGESFVHWRRKWGIKGAIIMALNPKSFNQEIH